MIIESVFIFCSGVAASDFLTQATFYAVYLLQDIMMILVLPNFSVLHCCVILLFHAALVYYTDLLASSPSAELVGYFAPQFDSLVALLIRRFAMQQPTYWAGKLVAVFLALVPYFFFRVFFNGLPKQIEADGEANGEANGETDGETAVDMGKPSRKPSRKEIEVVEMKAKANEKEGEKGKSSDESEAKREAKPAESQLPKATSPHEDESQPVRASAA